MIAVHTARRLEVQQAFIAQVEASLATTASSRQRVALLKEALYAAEFLPLAVECTVVGGERSGQDVRLVPSVAALQLPSAELLERLRGADVPSFALFSRLGEVQRRVIGDRDIKQHAMVHVGKPGNESGEQQHWVYFFTRQQHRPDKIDVLCIQHQGDPSRFYDFWGGVLNESEAFAEQDWVVANEFVSRRGQLAVMPHEINRALIAATGSAHRTALESGLIGNDPVTSYAHLARSHAQAFARGVPIFVGDSAALALEGEQRGWSDKAIEFLGGRLRTLAVWKTLVENAGILPGLDVEPENVRSIVDITAEDLTRRVESTVSRLVVPSRSLANLDDSVELIRHAAATHRASESRGLLHRWRRDREIADRLVSRGKVPVRV